MISPPGRPGLVLGLRIGNRGADQSRNPKWHETGGAACLPSHPLRMQRRDAAEWFAPNPDNLGGSVGRW